MYHYIRVPPSRNADPIGYGLSVTPTDFAAQMDWLAANGYHPITIADIRLYLDGAKPLPDKPVALTFDDGYLDLYTTAFPILKTHRFTATAYIVSGFVGAPNRNVTSDEIVEMDRYGIEIGAHTFSHQDLTKVSGDRLDYELRASKQALETIVGHPVVDFCYPAGKYDASVIAAVEAAGYASATTTDEGVDHTYGDRFTWARVRVAGGESLADFARGVSRTETGVAITVQPAPVQLPRVAPILPGIFGDLR
jgi:peptidoglycan/xylan/chitin deacetylase (PgdA/CDA1 family)